MTWSTKILLVMALTCLHHAHGLQPEWFSRPSQIKAYLKYDPSLQVTETSKNDTQTITVTVDKTAKNAEKKAQALATLLHPYGNQQWKGGAVVTQVVFNDTVVVRKALPTDPDNAFTLTKQALAGNSLYIKGLVEKSPLATIYYIIPAPKVVQYYNDNLFSYGSIASEVAAAGIANVYGLSFLKVKKASIHASSDMQIRSNQIQAYLKFDSSLQVDVTSKDDKETITVTLKNTDTAAAKKAQALATLLYPYGNQQWQGGAVITHVVFNGAVVVRKALPTDADNALALTKLAMTGNTLYRQMESSSD
ncbi:hypothetical protein N2152v2_001572 [Parachlorella kessleri]